MASRTSQRRTWGKGTGPGPRARAWLGAALILAGSFPGCGYTVRNSLPSNLKTLAIPVFANNTVEFGLSDAVLRGAVVAYKNQVFGYTSQERATQYEIVLTVQATFRDMIRNRDLWREDALTVRTTHNVVAVGGQPAQT